MPINAADIQTKKQQITVPGSVFEIEEVGLDGRSYRAYKHAPKTVADVIQSGRNHGDLDFLVYENQRYSFRLFFEKVDALAAAFQSDFGVEKGDRVAIAMRNNPEWGVAFAAATLIGAIVVPINSWGKSEELNYAIKDCCTKLLVCDEARLQLIDANFSALDIDVIVAGADQGFYGQPRQHCFEAVLATAQGKTFSLADVAPEDSCVILYTSGSTGFPKGVVHRHIAVCQTLMNIMFLGLLLSELEGTRQFKGGAERETPILTIPLFHTTGLLSGYLLPLQMGQKVVMLYKWDCLKALGLIEREKVTSFTSVPAVVQDLLSHPAFDNHNTDSLIRVSAAGAATPSGLAELIREKAGNPSRSVGWGLTETVGVGSLMSGAIFDLKPDSAGIQSPIMDLRFVDDTGQILAQGQTGEIECYGVTCTAGYWNKPESNAQIFDADGWMKTGDLGTLDDEGFLHITGRIKEIVIRGGENIYPGEIEQAAYELDGVRENVVFGVPDDVMGEELVMVAFIGGDSANEDTLREYLSGRLASYKVPKYIVVTDDSLPKNASEKLHKLAVREQFLASIART